ncbi:hypothetical protein RCC89_03730 [Cytophagaceae bacterium ABcell3]|nr:hypothetical protein RCC89_03730 [Cytophagaceae bacterium ABcell3]
MRDVAGEPFTLWQKTIFPLVGVFTNKLPAQAYTQHYSFVSFAVVLKVWARDTAGEPFTLWQKTIYGDSAGLSQPETDSLKGKPYKVYDEAGYFAT